MAIVKMPCFGVCAVIFALTLTGGILGSELKDYCSLHRFEILPGGLGFTKEVVSTEYANLGDFKAIHCCLRGSRSIEWYKDNRAYPWPGVESHFILYPESLNQTIYTQETRASDAGRYSCRARNDTYTLEGDITLTVLEKDSGGYTGEPKPTYKPTSQLVALGGTARLFCEAYLGRVDLPDARNSVTWSKVGSNLTLSTHGRFSQHRVSRDDDQIVGSYLEIQGVKLEDYAEYICEVKNSVDQMVTLSAHIYQQEPQLENEMRNGSWRKAILLAVLVLVILLSAATFYARCWLPLALLCRNKFAALEENDGKDCDALVCYHEKDASLVVGIIIPTLESRHRYKCTALELSHLNRNWALEIGPNSATARRIIVVLSPASLENTWTETGVATVLQQLASFPTRTLVVALKELPNATSTVKSSRRICTDEQSIGGVKILRWVGGDGGSKVGEFKFWCRLRLGLPPVRPGSNRCQSASMIVQVNGKSVQPKARSRESLEVLV